MLLTETDNGNLHRTLPLRLRHIPCGMCGKRNAGAN